MCINMPKTIEEERLRGVLPIYNKEIKLVDETGTLFDLVNYIKKENNWKGDVSFKRFYTSRFEFMPLRLRLKTIADIIGNNSYKPLTIM